MMVDGDMSGMRWRMRELRRWVDGEYEDWRGDAESNGGEEGSSRGKWRVCGSRGWERSAWSVCCRSRRVMEVRRVIGEAKGEWCLEELMMRRRGWMDNGMERGT